MPSCTIDLFTVSSENSLYQKIYNSLGKLVIDILPKQKRAIEKLNQIFSSFNPKIELSILGQKVIFKPDSHCVDNITDILMSLDMLAVKENKKIVILMDEFQQITTLDKTEVIEGAIRHAIERSKNVSYIFSGSNRHLLAKLFEDSNRPLYQCCDKLQLDRISQDHYIDFLTQAAIDQWQQPLNEQALCSILQLTRRHPYYVNVLCSRLWRSNQAPSGNQVFNEWLNYVQEEKIKVVTAVTNMSNNQTAMLIELGSQPCKEPTGKKFLNQVDLPSASANQALKTLLQKDYIFKNEHGEFEVLDPVFAFCLRKTHEVTI